jgi:uncharacterized protein with PQ loop repeat
MSDLKSIIGIIAVVLTFVGYAPYIRDILKNKTKPHIFSWLIWSIVTAIIYALQVSSGAGPGSWGTLWLTVILFLICVLGLKNGRTNIKKIDVVFLLLALLALPLWLVIKQPVLSIILLSTIDMLGFLPTIRKSWAEPYSETLSLYTITTFRHALSILALAEYNIVTWLFPASWVIANALFSIMLIVRRKQISNEAHENRRF